MKLGIFEESYTSHVSWYDEDDGEGGQVGQESSVPVATLMERSAKAKAVRNDDGRGDFEYLAVELAARAWADAHPDFCVSTTRGYQFETKGSVAEFLKAMRGAAKAAHAEYDGIPWPDWAVKAQAEGWKPPKGWKP